jgi:hypothetical protein
MLKISSIRDRERRRRNRVTYPSPFPFPSSRLCAAIDGDQRRIVQNDVRRHPLPLGLLGTPALEPPQQRIVDLRGEICPHALAELAFGRALRRTSHLDGTLAAKDRPR